jgi:hypothetical protein
MKVTNEMPAVSTCAAPKHSEIEPSTPQPEQAPPSSTPHGQKLCVYLLEKSVE